MKRLPNKLQDKITQRINENTLRCLGERDPLIDFSSNDYLGFSKSQPIFEATHRYVVDHNMQQNGATGSRLLSGNHPLYAILESTLCEFHNSEAALIFNSGYDANLGLFSCIPQRDDIILYDELIHASIRDGIQLSHAKAYKFKHNDLEALEKQIRRHSESVSESHQEIYVATESVFSMDGDSPDLKTISELCKKYSAHLVVDEAHAIGVFGDKGKGLIQDLHIEGEIFARLVTFGKALGSHGAAILGDKELIQYLTNFARSFIYTTALPPHTLATIFHAYQELYVSKAIVNLHEKIQFFKSEQNRLQLNNLFIKSHSAIHCCIIPGNSNIKFIADQLLSLGFLVKPILAPTVSKGSERLRFCLHAYNSKQDITKVLERLATFVNA